MELASDAHAFTVQNYLISQFNQEDTSDIQVRILDTVTGESKKLYHLHKFVISQCRFFSRMLQKKTAWKEACADDLSVSLYESNFVTEDVLDLFFQMLYRETFVDLQESIERTCMQLHYLSKRTGFDRGRVYCECLISKGTNLSNMMDILSYCVTTSMYHGMIFETVIQWVKIFLFHLNMCSMRRVQTFDMHILKEIVNAPDMMSCDGSKRCLIDLYEKAHGNNLHDKSKVDLAQLKAQFPCTENQLNRLVLQRDPREHRTIYVFSAVPCWRKIPNQPRTEHEDPMSVFPMESGFVMCECIWKTYITHNHRTGHTGISITTHTRSAKGATRKKQIIFNVDVIVHVIHRTDTQTSHHKATIVSDHVRLDLRNGVESQSMEDCFIIEDDSENQLHVIGFVLDLKVEARKDVWLSPQSKDERPRGNTC